MEAIIYLPGLGTRLFDQTLESFAYRLKKALDINDSDAANHYEVEFRKVNFGKDNRQESNIATIYTLNGGKRTDIYELFELEYGKNLVDKFENKNIIVSTIFFIKSSSYVCF